MPRKPGTNLNNDYVNHPQHYTMDPHYEVIDVIRAWGLDKDYALGNAIKYIARAKHKGDFVGDLRKAQWYLNQRVEWRESLDDRAGISSEGL